MIGAFLLVGIVGYFYLRAPHFSGSTASSIDVTMWPPDLAPGTAKPLVQAILTNAPACASLFDVLRSARFRMDHKCAEIGSVTIRYSNGKTDTLALLPGHDPTGYEFRFRGWLYRLPRERFYQVLRDAGIDPAKIPEGVH